MRIEVRLRLRRCHLVLARGAVRSMADSRRDTGQAAGQQVAEKQSCPSMDSCAQGKRLLPDETALDQTVLRAAQRVAGAWFQKDFWSFAAMCANRPSTGGGVLFVPAKPASRSQGRQVCGVNPVPEESHDWRVPEGCPKRDSCHEGIAQQHSVKRSFSTVDAGFQIACPKLFGAFCVLRGVHYFEFYYRRAPCLSTYNLALAGPIQAVPCRVCHQSAAFSRSSISVEVPLWAS